MQSAYQAPPDRQRVCIRVTPKYLHGNCGNSRTALRGIPQRPPVAVASDRGCQYASRAFRRLLTAQGMVCSMSRKGNAYDNAPMESFFGSFKRERVHHARYAMRDQARTDVFEYIEAFCNRRRLHSTLGYQSPDEFEANGHTT